MILIMKKTPITKTIVLESSPHQYWGAWKKIEYLQKNFTYFHWTLFFKLPKILGPIQVLINSVKKHDYNNLIFEIHVKLE